MTENAQFLLLADSPTFGKTSNSLLAKPLVPLPAITDEPTRKENNAKQNGFLSRLQDIMTDEKVETFFKDYFSTWSDTKAALMLMQTYVSIDDSYFAQVGQRMPPEQIVVIVRKMIGDADCRKILVEAMNQYTTDSDSKFLEAYKQVSLLE